MDLILAARVGTLNDAAFCYHLAMAVPKPLFVLGSRVDAFGNNHARNVENVVLQDPSPLFGGKGQVRNRIAQRTWR